MNITTVTVNFRTPTLAYDCVNSFRKFYPDLRYIVVDNGGCEDSIKLFRKMRYKELIELVENTENIGHGLALNQAIELVTTDYVFLLDSDTKTKQGGFLEKMLELFKNDRKLFAAGWLRYVNESGVAYRYRSKRALKYIHPYACLLDVGKFRKLEPFTEKGAPATDLMRSAAAARFTLADFPVHDYIWHKEAGTRGMYEGNIRPATDAEPGNWKRMRI